MIRGKALSLEQALQKARHYCGYQERCHREVQEKLYSFGLRKKDVEQALATLIEENYLNEQRFAVQYAGGHFRLKSWGRVRIRYELKQKQVSDPCIKKALATIGEEEYAQKSVVSPLKILFHEVYRFLVGITETTATDKWRDQRKYRSPHPGRLLIRGGKE